MPHKAHTALASVIADLLHHPIEQLLRKWNYKAALASSVFRSILFFAANISAGWTAGTGAAITEFVFRFGTSGFFGALTQSFRRVEPARTGMIAAMVILPLLAHTLELFVHWWRGTVNLGLSITVSLCFTAWSTSFNLFAMRRGVLTVGDADSRSICSDLKAMPHLVVAFVRALFREFRSAARGRAAGGRETVRTRRAPAKTLHVTNAYHPSSGGIRTFYRALLESANHRHRHIRLVVPGPVTDREDVGRFGRIYYVRSRPAPAFDRRYRLMLRSQERHSRTG